MGSGSFPGVNRLGRGVDQPPQSSAKVKERVELYLYSPLGLRVLFWDELYLYLYLYLYFYYRTVSILRLPIFRVYVSSQPIPCFQGRLYVGY